MQHLFKYCFGLLVCSLIMVSCTKEEAVVVDTGADEEQNLQSAEDEATADALFSDVYDIQEEESQQHSELSDGFTSNDKEAETRGTCATVTMDKNDDPENIFPVTVTMDFGDGCTSDRGREVSGKIITVYSARLRTAGATRTMTFENLVVNGFKISGTKTIKNNGLNDEKQFSYTVTLENGSIESPEGKMIEHAYSRTRTWVEGMDTNYKSDGVDGVLDDVWEVTGSASGVNRNGVSYKMEITTPLRREITCMWLVSGVKEIKTDNRPEAARIDYGDGTCDNLATISVGDRSKEIELPKKR